MTESGQVFRVFWQDFKPVMQIRANGNSTDIRTIKLFDDAQISCSWMNTFVVLDVMVLIV